MRSLTITFTTLALLICVLAAAGPGRIIGTLTGTLPCSVQAETPTSDKELHPDTRTWSPDATVAVISVCALILVVTGYAYGAAGERVEWQRDLELTGGHTVGKTTYYAAIARPTYDSHERSDK